MTPTSTEQILGGGGLGIPYFLFAVTIFNSKENMGMGINEVNLDHLSLTGAEELIGKFCSKTMVGCGTSRTSNETGHRHAMNEYPHFISLATD
jgi:hypothetical protein|tara:strand:- start:2187 stop:2465 length:279 start_codon:yes stop_codon:yes gene_type:complete